MKFIVQSISHQEADYANRNRSESWAVFASPEDQNGKQVASSLHMTYTRKPEVVVGEALVVEVPSGDFLETYSFGSAAPPETFAG